MSDYIIMGAVGLWLVSPVIMAVVDCIREGREVRERKPKHPLAKPKPFLV